MFHCLPGGFWFGLVLIPDPITLRARPLRCRTTAQREESHRMRTEIRVKISKINCNIGNSRLMKRFDSGKTHAQKPITSPHMNPELTLYNNYSTESLYHNSGEHPRKTRCRDNVAFGYYIYGGVLLSIHRRQLNKSVTVSTSTASTVSRRQPPSQM